MVDRLRALLDRPLDPSAARAILIIASGIFLGLAALFILASSEPDSTASQGRPPSLDASSAAPVEEGEGDAERTQPTLHGRQDPQDIAGSVAAERAARALRSHRALQHVPYRSGDLAIVLIGARGPRALLRVTASTLPAARGGWRRFLRRYGDPGEAYIPVFRSKRDRRG